MVSGPLIKSINNSGLGRIKRILSGGTPFLGGERYLQFGTELHYRCLERKKGKWKACDDEEKAAMIGGIKSLHNLKLFKQMRPGAIIEKLHKHPKAFGIHGMHGTIDLKKTIGRRKIGVDLKTTSCKTEDEFVAKAIKLDYPRQAVVYEELAGLNEFYIIGISKAAPDYPCFIFDINNFSYEKQRSTEEAKFLLQFYRDYGLPLKSGVKGEDLTKFTDPGRGRNRKPKKRRTRS